MKPEVAAKKKLDEKGLSKKLEDIKERIKKEKNIDDSLRALIFKDGVCVSSSA